MKVPSVDTARGVSQLIEQLKLSIVAYPAIWGALAAFWAWQFSLFQSPSAFFGGTPCGRGDVGLYTLLGTCAACVAMTCAHGRARRVLRAPAELAPVAVVMTASTAIGQAGSTAWLWGVLTSVAGLVGGAASAILLVELGRLFAQLGPVRALYVGAVGMCIGIAAGMLINLVTGVVRLLLLAVTPVVSALLVARARNAFAATSLFPMTSAVIGFPHKYAVTCLMQGVSFGVMTVLQGDELRNATASSGTTTLWYGAAFLVAILLLVTTVMISNLDYNHMIYRIAFPLLSVGFLLLVLAPSAPRLAGWVYAVGYCYMYVIPTCLNALFVRDFKVSVVWIVALSTAALQLGQLVGLFATGPLERVLGSVGAVAPDALACAMCLLLPLTGLMLLDESNPLTAWGAVRPSAVEDPHDAALRAALGGAGLTARETDVALLLGRGLTKRYIAQELGISEETAKSHIGNIYRKFDVHSQQDLIIKLRKM